MKTTNKKHKVTLILTARQVKAILSQVKDYNITASAGDWDKILNGTMDKPASS
jgi:hypothetical protein